MTKTPPGFYEFIKRLYFLTAREAQEMLDREYPRARLRVKVSKCGTGHIYDRAGGLLAIIGSPKDRKHKRTF